MTTSGFVLTKEQWKEISDLLEARVLVKTIHIEPTNLNGVVAVGLDKDTKRYLISPAGKTMVV